MPLPDDLVTGGKRNQVGEAFEGHPIAIVHEAGDRVAKRQELGHARAARAGRLQPEQPDGVVLQDQRSDVLANGGLLADLPATDRA